jgi:predicted negative regulator of RcsB-dependent stress response
MIGTGKARALGMLEFVYGGALGVGFVLAYLWWQHRDLAPLDPSSDARAYQAAMLARIDKQIRLLSRIRYWYLLPLYIPGLWVIKQMWKKNPMMALVSLVVYTGVYALVGWLNESWGVRKLQAERARIAGLYEE